MSTLTKAIRENMREAVLNHAFQAKEEAAKKELIAAGVALYMSVHTDYLPIMQRLPSGFLYSSDRFDVNIGGQQHRVQLDKTRLMTYESRSEYYPIEANNSFAIDYLRANDKVSDVDNQRSQKFREVTAILESVRTFKKLWEVWPEAKPLLEKFETKPPAAFLPAIQFDRINAELGLPPATNDIPWTHRMTANGGYEIGYFGPNGFVKTEGEVASLETANAIVSAHNDA